MADKVPELCPKTRGLENYLDKNKQETCFELEKGEAKEYLKFFKKQDYEIIKCENCPGKKCYILPEKLEAMFVQDKKKPILYVFGDKGVQGYTRLFLESFSKDRTPEQEQELRVLITKINELVKKRYELEKRITKANLSQLFM